MKLSCPPSAAVAAAAAAGAGAAAEQLLLVLVLVVMDVVEGTGLAQCTLFVCVFDFCTIASLAFWSAAAACRRHPNPPSHHTTALTCARPAVERAVLVLCCDARTPLYQQTHASLLCSPDCVPAAAASRRVAPSIRRRPTRRQSWGWGICRCFLCRRSASSTGSISKQTNQTASQEISCHSSFIRYQISGQVRSDGIEARRRRLHEEEEEEQEEEQAEERAA